MSGLQKGIKVFGVSLALFIIVNIASAIIFAFSLVTNISMGQATGENFTETYKNIKKIDIDLSATKLNIKQGDEFKLEAANITKSFKTSFLNGTLKIKERGNWFSNNNNTSTVTLYLPKFDFINELNIDYGAGFCNIDNISVNELYISNGAGKVDITNSSFNKTNIDGGVGELIVSSSVLNDLDLDSGIGNIDIEAEITGKSKIDSGIGKIKLLLLGNKEDYQINASKGIGSISIDGNKDASSYGNGNNKINIDGGIGEIVINFSR